MRSCLILLRRELGSYFVNWTGYVVISIVLFLFGLGFVGIIESVNSEPITRSVSELFLDSYYFWIVLIIVVPIITMRTFARERSSGTIETLMTAPVKNIEIVAAKYLGAFIFYVIIWSPLLICMLIAQYYAPGETQTDYGKLLSAFAGIILLGTLFIAIGCFSSVLSKNQISAAITGYAFVIALFTLAFVSYSASVQQYGFIAKTLAYLNMIEHIRDFARGVIDTRPLVFYISTSFLFLNLTLKAVESRRWK